MSDNMKLKILTLIFAVLLFNSVSALQVELTVPDVVDEGEMISFNYALSSETAETITFIPHIDCATGADDYLNEKSVELEANETYTGAHSLVELSYKYFEDGFCTAYIYVTSPEQETFSETFEIKVALHLDATTDSYAPNETRNKKVFLVGETAQIRNKATTNNYENAQITFTSEVKLNGKPVATFTEETFESELLYAGSYEIRVTASAPDHKPALAVTRFTVAEKHVTPKHVEYSCNLDGECQSEEGETIEFCPEDCLPHTEVIVSDNIESESISGIPVQGGTVGSAYCLFDGVCIGNTNFGIFVVLVISIFAGFLFLRKKKVKA